jgi:Bacterial Ig-like domain (group 3)
MYQTVQGGGIGIDGVLMLAGGNDGSSDLASSEVYGFATVKTDAADYAPGSIVTITGSGWQPGETVTLTFLESPLIDTPSQLTAIADANGNIVNSQFSPDQYDVGVKFYLTAAGSASQAQTTFTDNKTVTIAFSGAGSGNVTSSGGSGSLNCNSTSGAASGTCSDNRFGNTDTVTLTATPTSPSTVGTWTVPAYTIVSGCTSGSATCKFTMTNSSQTITVQFLPGSASKLAITSVNGGANPAVGTPFSVVVQSQDSGGNPSNVIANTGVSLSLNTGTGILGGTLTGTITAGTNSVTISGVTYSKAESGVILTATRTSGDSLLPGNSSPFTVNPGSLNHLLFLQQPTNTVAGQTITPAVTVEEFDVNNNLLTNDNTTHVVMSIFTNPGSGTLSGSTNVIVSGGIATFSNLSINNVGNGYVLQAQAQPASLGITVTSNSFNVTSPGPTKLAFTTTAKSGVVGQCLGAITVQTQDAGGTPTNPTSAVQVDLSILSGGTGGFYSDSACSLGISNFSIPTSSNSGSFYFAGTAVGSPNIQAADHTGTLTPASQTETVNQASTGTSVTSDNHPSVFGQSVTFTATVTVTSPGSGTPTGNVQFYDGANLLGSGSLSGSAPFQATYGTSGLSVTTHSITAKYVGDTNFATSTSSIFSQEVDKADTTTTVGTISPEPSQIGQSYSVAYTVVAKSPGSGTPTGDVTVDDSDGNHCTASVADGSCSLTSTSSGTKTITATYVGDTNFNGSNATESHVVTKRPTSTKVSNISPGSVALGVSTTITVTVVDTGTGTASNPGGTVALTTSGSGTFGTCTLAQGVNPLGTVSCDVSYTPSGTVSGTSRTDTITASFTASDSTHENSSDTTGKTLTVTKRSTSTTVTSLTPDNVVVAQSTTVKVTVVDTDSGTASNPGGTVALLASGNGSFGTCTLAQGANPTGTVSCDVSYTPSDALNSPQTITASFTATDNVHKDSADATGKPLTVTRRATSTGVVLTPNTVVTGEPSTVGVTVTDTETAGTKQYPTGTVSLGSSEATDVFTGTCTLASTAAAGVSTCSVSVKPVHVATSPHTITATFSQTPVHLTSSGNASLTVNKADTATSVSSSNNPITLGESVSFTAAVTVKSPGSGSPTGSVQFYIDGVAFGSAVTLSGGSATSGSTTSLTAGPHNITAAYSGDSDFNSSNNNTSPLVENVNYNFAGLSDPYAPPSSGRSYKIKSAIPLKWQYTDINGTAVPSANAAPTVIIYYLGTCGGDLSGLDALTITASGNSGYQYDPTTLTWQFNWKTTGMQPGCYGITIQSGLTSQVNPPPPNVGTPYFPIALTK